VVHVTSSRRSHRSEVKDGRFDGVGCDSESRTEIPFINCNFLFSSYKHFSLMLDL
jgi:hypothetical protein